MMASSGGPRAGTSYSDDFLKFEAALRACESRDELQQVSELWRESQSNLNMSTRY